MGSFKVGDFTIARGGVPKINDVPFLTEQWRDSEFLAYVNGAVVTKLLQALPTVPTTPFVIHNGNIVAYESIQAAVNAVEPGTVIYVPQWYNGENEHVDVNKAVTLAGVPFGQPSVGSLDLVASCTVSGLRITNTVVDTGGSLVLDCEVLGTLQAGAHTTTYVHYSRVNLLVLYDGSNVHLTNSTVGQATGPGSATLFAHASLVGSVDGQLAVRCGLLGNISGGPNARLVLPFSDVQAGSVLGWDGMGWVPIELHSLSGGVPTLPFIMRGGSLVTFGTLAEALQAALSGETVYVPPGDWDATGCTVRDNVRIIGLGRPRLVVSPGSTGLNLTLRNCELYGVIIARSQSDDFGYEAPSVVEVADHCTAALSFCGVAQVVPWGGVLVPNVKVGLHAELRLDYVRMMHFGGSEWLPAIECADYSGLVLKYCDFACQFKAVALGNDAEVESYHSNVWGLIDGDGTVEATLSNFRGVLCRMYSFASHVSLMSPIYEYFGELPFHPGNVSEVPAVPIVTGDSYPYSVWAKFALSGLPDVNTAGANVGDVLSWDGTVWRPVPPGTPGAHAVTHQAGGSDEISVAGLHGRLADFQAADQIGPWSVDVTKEPSVGDVLTWDGQKITWSRPPSGTGLVEIGVPNPPLVMPSAAIESVPSGNSLGSLQVQISTSSVPR